ncbi:uncharacterized protein LOC119402923 [Rhipicephalus sanguineus]|uniref:uncharacterized protein LOC119402923 n=1 Tax=Rhipicephalus sanguineus TaxID=34632 RepID=UPI0020C45009|nr:uncharacterized protein LOC119402923 [Rhipicephalus sanguineus]
MPSAPGAQRRLVPAKRRIQLVLENGLLAQNCHLAGSPGCAQKHDRQAFCNWTGQTYRNVCPQTKTKVCSSTGERVCLCEDGYYRQRFYYECVTLRNCVKREVAHIQLLCAASTLYMVGASTNLVDPNKAKCVRSQFVATHRGGCRRYVQFFKNFATAKSPVWSIVYVQL